RWSAGYRGGLRRRRARLGPPRGLRRRAGNERVALRGSDRAGSGSRLERVDGAAQGVLQPPEGADVAVAGRRLLQAEDPGRLDVGQLLQVAQDQSLAVDGVEGLDPAGRSNASRRMSGGSIERLGPIPVRGP